MILLPIKNKFDPGQFSEHYLKRWTDAITIKKNEDREGFIAWKQQMYSFHPKTKKEKKVQKLPGLPTNKLDVALS